MDSETLVDFSQIVVGGVALIPLVVGLMEYAKKFGLTGRPLMVAAFVVLLIFGGVAGAISEGLLPQAALPWIRVAIFALGFVVAGLAAMGLYDVAKRFRPPIPVVSELIESDTGFREGTFV